MCHTVAVLVVFSWAIIDIHRKYSWLEYISHFTVNLFRNWNITCSFNFFHMQSYQMQSLVSSSVKMDIKYDDQLSFLSLIFLISIGKTMVCWWPIKGASLVAKSVWLSTTTLAPPNDTIEVLFQKEFSRFRLTPAPSLKKRTIPIAIFFQTAVVIEIFT